MSGFFLQNKEQEGRTDALLGIAVKMQLPEEEIRRIIDKFTK